MSDVKEILSDTQAVLLLCGYFGKMAPGSAKPLAAGEYGRLARWLVERQQRLAAPAQQRQIVVGVAGVLRVLGRDRLGQVQLAVGPRLEAVQEVAHGRLEHREEPIAHLHHALAAFHAVDLILRRSQ